MASMTSSLGVKQMVSNSCIQQQHMLCKCKFICVYLFWVICSTQPFRHGWSRTEQKFFFQRRHWKILVTDKIPPPPPPEILVENSWFSGCCVYFMAIKSHICLYVGEHSCKCKEVKNMVVKEPQKRVYQCHSKRHSMSSCDAQISSKAKNQQLKWDTDVTIGARYRSDSVCSEYWPSLFPLVGWCLLCRTYNLRGHAYNLQRRSSSCTDIWTLSWKGKRPVHCLKETFASDWIHLPTQPDSLWIEIHPCHKPAEKWKR